MANSNFVVHNGLTVGPLTIDASTGDITTTGNINLSGGGTVTATNVAVSAMSLGDTSVTIYDPGTGSNVRILIDGVTEQTIDASGVSVATGGRYAVNGVSVLNATTLGAGVNNSNLTVLGNLTSLSAAGTIQTTGVIYANATTPSTNTTSGALVVAGGVGIGASLYARDLQNTAIGNVTPASGTFTSLTSQSTTTLGAITAASINATTIGNVTPSPGDFTRLAATGILYANSATTSTSTSTGALVVTGGAGISGNVTTGGILTVTGQSTLTGIVYANANVNTTSTTTGAVIIPGVGGLNVGGNAYVGQNLYVGGASAFTTSLTTPTVIAVDNGSTYAQMAQINTGLTGSADFIAYPGDYPGPSSDHGWMDLGFTGTGFNDANYTITKPQDGYLFASGANTSVGGNLVLATDYTGGFNDIVIGVGSFMASSEVARFHGNTSNNGNLTIKYTTTSTNTTSGALQVKGGVGVAGNINVGGNINVTNVGGITIAGQLAATIADAIALSIALGG